MPPQRMGNIRLQVIFVPKPELRVKRRKWVVGFFQVTTQNMLLFISCQGILSKFLYIKPNPYQTIFGTKIFRRVFCTKIFDLMGVWICMVRCFQVTPFLCNTFKGIFSNFSYVKPNPYYSLFCALGVLCYQSYINSWR